MNIKSPNEKLKKVSNKIIQNPITVNIGLGCNPLWIKKNLIKISYSEIDFTILESNITIYK